LNADNTHTCLLQPYDAKENSGESINGAFREQRGDAADAMDIDAVDKDGNWLQQQQQQQQQSKRMKAEASATAGIEATQYQFVKLQSEPNNAGSAAQQPAIDMQAPERMTSNKRCKLRKKARREENARSVSFCTLLQWLLISYEHTCMLTHA
jgi:hypothetical protein